MNTTDNKANERTFQGVLLNAINQILTHHKDIKFTKILQEQNIGVGKSRFADGLLYSSININQYVLFELKNNSWDATDDKLVQDALLKAMPQGIPYFVTGTPRQLVIWQTFKDFSKMEDRKLKIYNLSNIKDDNAVTTTQYEKQITSVLKIFLKDLSDIFHGFREIKWDSIDKYFVSKLSAYILEASMAMYPLMSKKINQNAKFRYRLTDYLTEQDVFGVSTSFDEEDTFNVCQLANYLLYLKILFYTYLQRDVPALNLKKLYIPSDKKLLNDTLKNHFEDVLQHDFELIFQTSILDEFEFPEVFIPILKANIEEIETLNFTDLNTDIIGNIYNTLINNQEQHDRGQHFTNTNEVDIVNAFCINDHTELIIDTACGAGTFLVRAYQFLKHYKPKETHEKLLERLWGVEIAPFAAFLSAMNLSLLNVKIVDNYPAIIKDDFSNLETASPVTLIYPNQNKLASVTSVRGDKKKKQVKLPKFDACVGNPPYIRQELIGRKDRWQYLTMVDYGIKKINSQADLYVYYLIHTSAFLKEGGRLGYVIASSWLDSNFGRDLQKFILDHFKLIAIIDHQTKRSFETASVNTVILILEKCQDKKKREENQVKFVRVYAEYETLIGKTEDRDRIQNLKKFTQTIEKAKKSLENQDYSLFIENQNTLELNSTTDNKYTNGYWGAKYLRSPEIYQKIISIGKDKLIPLSQVAEVKYGIKTGVNDFFYVIDKTEEVFAMTDEQYLIYFGAYKANTTPTDKQRILKESKTIHANFYNELINYSCHPAGFWDIYGYYYSEMDHKHYMLEREYFKPLFKTQSEADKLAIDIDKLKYRVLICNESKNQLKKTQKQLLAYIEAAEALDVHTGASAQARVRPLQNQDWFNLGEELFVGDFIFPSKIGEYYRLIDNRISQTYCDKVNYNIKVKANVDSDILFAILNSITFRFLVDLFARQLTGSQTLSDVDVNVVEKTLIINPYLLTNYKKKIELIIKSLKNREQGSIYAEIKESDKRKLDEIILKELGLSSQEVDELYYEAQIYIKARAEKSDSVTNTKVKSKMSFEETVTYIQKRFDSIRLYEDVIEGTTTESFVIPNADAKIPKDMKNGNNGFFSNYEITFLDQTQTKLKFNHIEQFQLFYFLYSELGIRDMQIQLPVDSLKCMDVKNLLNADYQKNFELMKNVLKTIRSKFNPLLIYKYLVFKNQ
ncbi:MAG: N-6 DNA methylase [Microscillaceae bacterium]|jgi:type I restriction-modification system DNA methylase subunit|nr:N-6 DNA methylase [Microscillaceae bacterium]